MKVVDEMELVKYIVFDNGAKEKASNVIEEIESMIDADYTHFNTSVKSDEALLALVSERCGDFISNKVNFSETSIRVYWNGDQEKALSKLLDEITKEVYEEEMER